MNINRWCIGWSRQWVKEKSDIEDNFWLYGLQKQVDMMYTH